MSSDAALRNLAEAIDVIEETYEFMLAYAAQGRVDDMDMSDSGIRAYLKRAEKALGAIAATTLSDEAAEHFMDVVRQDAGKAGAAIRLVVAQPSLSSQMIDNLNAAIHLRALLTDLFLLDEALGLNVS